MPRKRDSYYDVLTAAINDMADKGYDSYERVAYWLELLKQAVQRTMKTPPEMERALRNALLLIYRRYIDKGEILKYNFGISRFTLDQVKPQLRAELDRRILASASLIRLNRAESMNKTLQRFQGWATSVPVGGTDIAKKKKIKEEIRKPLQSAPFEERRVLIDQGHKLRSALSDILAKDGGAIAAIWHSHWRELNYNYRPDHKQRDQKVYAVRGNWALEKGLMKSGAAGYTDEITQPSEEPFCRCFYQYLYSVDRLPNDMITQKGRNAMEASKEMAMGV